MKDSHQTLGAADSDSKFATRDSATNICESEGRVYVRRVKCFYQRVRRLAGITILRSFVIIP
jgi:hypothetical protein